MSDPRELQDGEGDPNEIEDAEDAEDAEAGDLDVDGGDDAGDEAQEEDQQEEVAAPPRRSRRERQADHWRAQARETGAQLTQLQQQFAQLQAQLQSRAPAFDPAAAARAQAEEMARVELMPVGEQIKYWADKNRNETAQVLQQFNFNTHDQMDRTAFEAAARTDPQRARLAPKVEQLLGALRQSGANQTRQNIYLYLLGAEVEERRLKQLNGKTGVARQTRRLVSQTTRPGNGRGDVARSGNGRSQQQSDEAMLRGITVDDL